MRRPILNHLKRGELVYEPFLGSGTTLAAAELTERVCCGIELDPKYVDVIVQRWQTLSGKPAKLEADGRTLRGDRGGTPEGGGMNRPLPPGDCGNQGAAFWPGIRTWRVIPPPRLSLKVRNRMETIDVRQRNVEVARECLRLIRDIADRGASSWDPNQVGYALQELSQVLFERVGGDDRVFEPVRAEEIPDLARLHEELQFVESASQSMFRPN